MIIQSKYAKIFNSKDLTRQKYDELHNFAVLIQNHKNTVSQYVNDNLLHFLDYKQKCRPKEQHEFIIKGKKIMAASKKDAIKKYNHRKK